jgi:lysophospholipase L1-like esterase
VRTAARGAGHRARKRRFALLLVAIAFATAACNPLLQLLGDSQTALQNRTLQTTLTPYMSVAIEGKSACGILDNPNPTCNHYDWAGDVAARIAHGPPKYVVTELGTNDAFYYSAADLVSLWPPALEHWINLWPTNVQVYWVNVPYMPGRPDVDPQVDTINQMLVNEASVNPRLNIIDLHTLMLGHDDWFEGDGVHLNALGGQAWADLVCHTVTAADYPGVPACGDENTTTTSTPDTTTTEPETTTTVPDTTTSTPDTTTSVPDTTTTDPDTTTTDSPTTVDPPTTEPTDTTTTDTTDTTGAGTEANRSL